MPDQARIYMAFGTFFASKSRRSWVDYNAMAAPELPDTQLHLGNKAFISD